MNVLINGQPVDIGIDNEKTLRELADSIRNWSAERNLILTGVYTGDDEYYPADEVEDTALDKIEEADFQIESKADLVIGSLSEAAGFCEKLLVFIGEVPDDPGHFEGLATDIAESLSWLDAVSSSVVSLLELDPQKVSFLDEPLSAHLDNLKKFAAEMKNGSVDTLVKAAPLVEKLKGLFKMMMFSDAMKNLVINSIDSPDQLIKMLDDIKNGLPQQLENLEKVAALFQSGKDNEAAELFYPFLDFMYAYLRTSVQTQPVFGVDPADIVLQDVSLEQRNEDIHNFLSEIVEVMENNDIISMADILEYEMKPLLSELPAYIDALVKKLSA